MRIIILSLVFLTQLAQAQHKSIKVGLTGGIKGVVVDEALNEPLPFAKIWVTDSTQNQMINGTTSDFDGNYSMILDPGAYFLYVSYVGMDSLKQPLLVHSQTTATYNLSMGIDKGTICTMEMSPKALRRSNRKIERRNRKMARKEAK